MVSVFANVARSGWWRAEGTISPVTVFGDVELDLREAAVPAGEVEIRAVAPFGDIDVVVPDGVIVELTGFSVFGRKKVDVRRPASIGSAPVVRVRARTVFGSVLVRS
jgi:predicted membrane protein